VSGGKKGANNGDEEWRQGFWVKQAGRQIAAGLEPEVGNSPGLWILEVIFHAEARALDDDGFGMVEEAI
jgi:hypothetical protein